MELLPLIKEDIPQEQIIKYTAKQDIGTFIFSAVDMSKNFRYSSSSVGLLSVHSLFRTGRITYT